MSASPEEVLATTEELWEVDTDYYPVRKFPEAQPCHGVQECLKFFARYFEAFSRYESAIRDVIAVGDDRVLACLNLRAEGRGSGINLKGDLYQCFWLRHGRFFHA